MDEATSALDTVTEQRIQASLDSLSVGRTSVIIAHRLSTIRGADRVAVIENEHIVELGTPGELLAMDGEFAKLWNHSLRPRARIEPGPIPTEEKQCLFTTLNAAVTPI